MSSKYTDTLFAEFEFFIGSFPNKAKVKSILQILHYIDTHNKEIEINIHVH